MRVIRPEIPADHEPREMEIRAAAAQATLDRFRDIPFEWGKHDCAKMAAFHCRRIGRPVLVLAKAGNYRSALGAKRALGRLGYADLPALADACFPVIAPAAARVGDLLQIRSDHPLGCVAIYLGNGAVVSYDEAAPGATTARLEEPPLRAWRVIGDG